MKGEPLVAWVIVCLVVSFAIMFLLGFLTGRNADGAEVPMPSARLWAAQVQEESGGDPNAYNRDEDAAGIVQIRPICLTDCNRITHGNPSWTRADRFDPAESKAMWRTYLAHYGRAYRRETGRVPTDEIYARIWNGGPDGWRQRSTDAYWQKVRATLNMQARGQGNI